MQPQPTLNVNQISTRRYNPFTHQWETVPMPEPAAWEDTYPARRVYTTKIDEDAHQNEPPQWKYDEGKILDDLRKYLSSTYGQHYTSENTGAQAIDIWEANGSVVETCRDTAIKYLMRYGKKKGYNEEDLLKAFHYIVFMMYYSRKKNKGKK